MTKDELNLLLYLESCAVNYGGKVESARMNAPDFEIVRGWRASGFVQFGRIGFKDIKVYNGIAKDHWVVLSDAAWQQAHAERRVRCDRLMEKLTINRIGLAA